MRLHRIALSLVAGLALCAAAALAADPFAGTAWIAIGDQVTATLAGFEDEVHQFTVVANDGAVIDAKVSPASGSSVKPALRIVRPNGSQVPTGSAQVSATEVRGFRVPFAGVYVLEVAAKKGTGAYRLVTSGRLGSRLRGIAPRASGEQQWHFAAVEGASLSVVASPRAGASGRTTVTITGLVDPHGAAVAVSPSQDGSASRVDGVTLGATGEYVLEYEVGGRAADVSLKFSFVNPATTPKSYTFGAAEGIPPGVVDEGEPLIPAREDYVGSTACGRCHTGVFTNWSQTAHNAAARTWDRVGLTGRAFTNDVNANGQDDFRDGLDLAVQPAFAAYGANAPKLSYEAGAALPYKIRIGAVTYDVERVMGGNGLWKQRYLVRVGRQLFPSPVQWNDVARNYVTYDATDWYDTANQPRYTAATQIPKDRSFEARCAGCHNTGATVSFDSFSGEYLTGYVEFNIGCEQCHGPGAAHAKKGDPSLIRDPRDLLDGTAAGVAAADAVCGRCHTRGTAKDAFPGTEVKAGYGFSAAGGVQQVGDPQSAFFVTTTSPSDFWGYKTNPLPALPGDTFAASKSHRQQSLDMAAGPHGPNASYSPTCFDCHDPHLGAQRHQVVTYGRRDKIVPTRTEDNSLCLSCHAGFGDFAAVSAQDVAAISTGAKPTSVVRAAVDHMKDRASMPVADAKYDPAGTGVGRCDTCHMVRTPKSAAYTTDKAGYLQGDEHSHTVEPLWPNVSVLYGTTNSCSVCHPRSPTDAAAKIIDQWSKKGADGDSTFHADTPRSFQNGTANAGSPSGGQRCAACHTTEGFVRIQVRGETLGQGDVDEIVKDSLAHDEGITCAACHGRSSSGAFAAGANPLRFPKSQLCGKCHNAQTVVFTDFRDRGEMVRHPQREMFDGTAGAQSPGYTAWENSVHAGFDDQCVTCHYNPTLAPQTKSHEFQPAMDTCSLCHGGLSTFDRTARADYDGDGVVEGVQTETTGLLAVLQAALLRDPDVTYTGGYFEFGGATDHKMTGASEAQKRAAYNHYSVSYDASLGVHNTARAVQLLQRSYKELTGTDVPGATIR